MPEMCESRAIVNTKIGIVNTIDRVAGQEIRSQTVGLSYERT
jgi:hypothetical protein